MAMALIIMGDSMVIDPLGAVLYHKAGEEDIYTITLEQEPLLEVREKFPFLERCGSF
jgi:omega-amidase